MRLQNKNNIINLSSSLLTFISNFFLNFTRLIIRSLVLRSFLCVALYLVFGIDTAYAWVDFKGKEHPDSEDPLPFNYTDEEGYICYSNRFTGESELLVRPEEMEVLRKIASSSNTPEEFCKGRRAYYQSKGSYIPAPNIPSGNPSTNPTPLPTITSSTLPKEPEWSSINTYPDHPPE